MRSNLLWAAIVAAAMLPFAPARAAEAAGGCAKPSCVRPDTLVSSTGYGRALIAADPAEAGRLAVGMTDTDLCGWYRQSVSVSLDDGASWQAHCLPFPDDEFFGWPHDSPAVAMGPQGVLLAAASYDDGADSDFVGLHRSTDDGASWEFIHAGGTGYFKGDAQSVHITVDDSGPSPYRGNAYIVYAAVGVQDDASRIRLSRSTDGGKSWGVVNVSPEWDNSHQVDSPSLAIARDGTLYLTHTLCSSFQCTGGDVLLYVSTNGGLSWQPKGTIATVSASHRPLLAIDASKGPYQGRLYLVTDDGQRVKIRQSSDQGVSWSAPVQVAKGHSTQFMPWACVSRAGELAVSWMDTRNDPQGKRFQPMAAVSSDGGASFSKPLVLDPDLSDASQTWGSDRVSLAWSGKQLRAAFHGPNDDGSDGLRLGGLR
ncbi:sialidase family protein [Ideonella sp. YS5]|uniref:sialidase family protein n=1 Tax=Ideonella sp. YS5 TaxID=3453714 RepID=UPI003EE9CDAC